MPYFLYPRISMREFYTTVIHQYQYLTSVKYFHSIAVKANSLLTASHYPASGIVHT